jgi:putative transposase
MASFSPQAGILALGASDKNRHGAYRALFRAWLDQAAIDDIRLALNQNQPLGNIRFMNKIARVTGERREARPRGRPRKDSAAAGSPRG